MIPTNSCPKKTIDKILTPREYFLPNASQVDVEKDPIVIDMIEKNGRVFIIDSCRITPENGKECVKGKWVTLSPP